MEYTIDYNTGITDSGYKDLDSAKEAADKGAAYTQQEITIHDEKGKEVTRRNWWGVRYNHKECEENDPIKFGDLGYYSDWQE